MDFVSFIEQNDHSHSHFYSHFGFLKILNPYFTLVLPLFYCCFRRLERVKGIEPSFLVGAVFAQVRGGISNS